MSGIVNKVKEVLHHDKNTGTTGTTSHTATGNATGTGTTGLTGTHQHNTGLTGGTTGTGTAEGVHGPHSSKLANTLDPRVDSDRDGRIGMNTGNTRAAEYTDTTGTTGTHHHGLTGTTAGNHSGLGGTGDRGGLSSSTNAGPHNSNLMNKVDPRVDSDLDHTGNRHGASKGGLFGAHGSHATAGSGTAQNTQGPHNSDTLNKLDPRVDADGDGSKTFGGNRTHA